MERIDADYPNDGTNSDGFDIDRAHLLIRGLPAGLACAWKWVSSPEPAVGVFTPAGTCQGRLRRHCVISCADPDRTRLS